MKAKNLFIALLFGTSMSQAQTMNQNFQTPPNSAKPRVWWHWMNGNITKDGIQKDLEWMSRIGIGGFQNFDANLFTPVVVPKKLVFMDADWKDAFKFTTELADKKGLEMAIAGSPGWSVTGGPWVEPKDGMKKFVWTETMLEGGKAFAGKLAEPSGVLSSFQNVEITTAGISGSFKGQKPIFYQDAMVIAYKIPNFEKTLLSINPKVSSSGGDFNVKSLTDGDLFTATLLPPKKVGEDTWIQYEFETPQTFKALSVVGAMHNELEQFRGSSENRSLQVSDDGINFKEITKIHGSLVPQTTVSFPATTAKYFRFVYKTLPGTGDMMAMMMGGGSVDAKPDGVNVSEFNLFNTDRINKIEDKAGFSAWKENGLTSEIASTDAISKEEIFDLTDKMNPDGTFNWTPPTGSDWKVLRFGYSLTGRQNHPASPEATGLEVDKLDKEAVKKYINTYLDMYKDATGGLMGAKGLQYMILDSYEAGHMNWTKSFPQEFLKRRGYAIQKWMPVLIGRVVGSSNESEKFLWDFRKTIGELISESHYDVIGEELHKRGMKRYTESHEGGRIYLADGMDVKRNADIPMAAMWTPGSLDGAGTEEVRSEADIREAASVANIYGQNLVAAESMTSIMNAFSWHPEKLKRTADLEMASGLNRFVIHTSVHQPLDDKKPGFSLGPFGQYFTRHETWTEVGGKAWMEYLGRSSYLLQQGKNVADILYLYGENENITWLCREKLPAIPAGYEFDFVNSTALINAIEVKNGKLVAKSGNTYEVLVLGESTKYMTLPVLKRLQTLAKAGAKIVGKKPEQSPSLGDNQTEFQTIANEIWKNNNIVETLHATSQGVATSQVGVIETQISNNSQQTLRATSLPSPDVLSSKTQNKILYRHRQMADQEIYWIDNRSDNSTDAEISFRVAGKVPELWNAVTGKTEKIAFQIVAGRTIVPLHLESWDAQFIVFKDKASQNSLVIKPKSIQEILTISTPWKVVMNNQNLNFDKLTSWSESTDANVKYFSGTASYSNSFKISKIDKSSTYNIDLGEVKNIAEVFVNGKNVGVAWKKPFSLDLSEALKIGDNTIEIKVTNLWVNRLIGDAQPETTNKTTFTTMPFYQPNSPLLPSGLMGPVKLISSK